MKYFVEMLGKEGAFHVKVEDARDVYILMEECGAIEKGTAKEAYYEGRLVETDKSNARKIWGEEIDDRQLMLRTLKGEFNKKTAMSVKIPKPKQKLNDYLDETEGTEEVADEKDKGPHKGVFYFDFYNEDTEMSSVYGFNIVLESKELNEDFDQSYDDHCEETESKYGVHDWSSRPVDGLTEFGYTSYEVEPQHYETVMELWRKYFESRGDVLATTAVTKVDAKVAEDGTALDIYNDILEK